ncbi:MAG: cation:proton antiporter [Rikenellaceae bacterium]
MLISLAYLFILGIILAEICEKLRIPSLIGMLLAGILLGPYMLNLLSPELLSISLELRQIALIVILMRAGLALDFGALKRAGKPAIFICFVPACFEIAGMLIIAPPLLGISLLDAAIMGSVVAAVSPAVVVPKMLHLMENRIGTDKAIPQMIMAGGSVDDIFVIVLFSIFTTLGKGEGVDFTQFANIPISIVTGVVLGVVTGYILLKIFKFFHLRDSLKLLVIMSVAFIFLKLESTLSHTVAISGLLAVMILGCTILKGNAPLAVRLSSKFSKVWVAAQILLFVLVGATVNIEYAASAGVNAVLVLLFVLVWRMVGVFVSTLAGNFNLKERIFCMIAYMPKATVQAAIGSLPLSMGLSCGDIVLTVAVLSILITAPLGAFGIDLSYKRLLGGGER